MISTADSKIDSKNMGVSKNNGIPKSSILIGFSVFHYFNHPFWGFSPLFWKHPYLPRLFCDKETSSHDSIATFPISLDDERIQDATKHSRIFDLLVVPKHVSPLLSNFEALNRYLKKQGIESKVKGEEA